VNAYCGASLIPLEQCPCAESRPKEHGGKSLRTVTKLALRVLSLYSRHYEYSRSIVVNSATYQSTIGNNMGTWVEYGPTVGPRWNKVRKTPLVHLHTAGMMERAMVTNMRKERGDVWNYWNAHKSAGIIFSLASWLASPCWWLASPCRCLPQWWHWICQVLVVNCRSPLPCCSLCYISFLSVSLVS
jgi:hypothetical protein